MTQPLPNFYPPPNFSPTYSGIGGVVAPLYINAGVAGVKNSAGTQVTSISTDVTLASDSNSKLVTEHAVKHYVDNHGVSIDPITMDYITQSSTVTPTWDLIASPVTVPATITANIMSDLTHKLAIKNEATGTTLTDSAGTISTPGTISTYNLTYANELTANGAILTSVVNPDIVNITSRTLGSNTTLRLKQSNNATYSEITNTNGGNMVLAAKTGKLVTVDSGSKMSVLNTTNTTATTGNALDVAGSIGCNNVVAGGNLILPAETITGIHTPLLDTLTIEGKATAEDNRVRISSGGSAGYGELKVTNAGTMSIKSTSGTTNFSDTTVSTSTTTGAVTISGGLGIAGACSTATLGIGNVEGLSSSTSAPFDTLLVRGRTAGRGNQINVCTDDSTASGHMRVDTSGYMALACDGGTTNFSDTLDSTAPYNGSVTFSGGVGITKTITAKTFYFTGTTIADMGVIDLPLATNNNVTLPGNTILTINNTFGNNAQLTGLTTGTNGRMIKIIYYSAVNTTVVLVHDSASSTAANRIYTNTGANVNLQANPIAAAELIYMSSVSRWVLICTNP